MGSWTRFHDKVLTDTVLNAFGFGDGGGGPTSTMLEMARRFAAIPGLPGVMTSTVQAFLDSTRDALAGQDHVPVWDGELYLEYHRGTYTSQGWIKRANRWAEHLYHDAEVWAAWAGLYDGRGAERQQTLNRGRQIVLLNQFHDILPGSSIREVYDDARRDHAEAAALAEQVRAEAQAVLAEHIIANVVVGSPETRAIVAFNGVAAARQDPWQISIADLGSDIDPSRIEIQDLAGAAVPVQAVATHGDNRSPGYSVGRRSSAWPWSCGVQGAACPHK